MDTRTAVTAILAATVVGVLIGHHWGVKEMYKIYGDALSAETVLYLAALDSEEE